MSEDDREQHLDQIFMALADRTRRAIVHKLTAGEASVSQINAEFDMSLNAVSKHLKVLERAGIIRRRIEGRVHHISLNPTQLAAPLDWISIYRHFWRDKLDDLTEHLENR